MRTQVDFFILGAQKAGTSSLHELLASHPDIALPRQKETHFFSHDQKFDKGLDWYFAQFAPQSGTCVRGEVDPEYLFHERAIVRIKKFFGDAKVLVVLRSPLDRSYSQYQMSVRRGYETLSFYDAIAQEKNRLAAGEMFEIDNFSYISRSMYSDQISQVLHNFPRENVMFIKFDDLSGENFIHIKFQEILMFIGVTNFEHQINSVPRANVASKPRFEIVNNLIYRNSNLKKFLSHILPSGHWRYVVASWLERKNAIAIAIKKGKSQKEKYELVPQNIRESLQQDLTRVENMTGLCLSDWISSLD